LIAPPANVGSVLTADAIPKCWQRDVVRTGKRLGCVWCTGWCAAEPRPSNQGVIGVQQSPDGGRTQMHVMRERRGPGGWQGDMANKGSDLKPLGRP
jgi:hypothetical protein